jgi:DNA-binding beta-propeller fold protein YncE
MASVLTEQEYRFALRLPHSGWLLVSSQHSHSVLVCQPEGRVISEIKENFNQPQGLAYHEEDKELYVVDRFNHCVKVFNDQFDFVRTIGVGQLNQPVGIALDKDQVCVADNENHRVAILSKDGTWSRFVGLGFGPTRGHLFCPCGVAVYKDLLIVAEWGNGRIQVFRNDQSILSLEGAGHAHSVTVSPEGFVYYAMYSNKCVGRFRIEYDVGDVPRFILESFLLELKEPPVSVFWDDKGLGVVTARRVEFHEP